MAYNKKNFRRYSKTTTQDSDAPSFEKKTTEQVVTERFIAALEKGEIPWKKPWATLKSVWPRNGKTGDRYHGCNVFLLYMAGFSDPRFFTFKQIGEMGGKVRKGEKGMPVVFYTQYKKEVENDLTGGKEMKSLRCVKHYWVFNAEQCEGLELPVLETAQRPEVAEVIEEAENVIKAYIDAGGPSLYREGYQAYYRLSEDKVVLPEMGLFYSTEEQYGTAFHELVHSTGHPDRLNRKDLLEVEGFGDANYSKEELTAEIGSALMLAELGIDSPELQTNQEAYINGWISKLKNDPKLILQAAGRGSTASKFIFSAGEVK